MGSAAAQKDSITVYAPGSPLRDVPALLRSMGKDIRAARELAWRLFIRDISAQYRQSLFGYVWAFLPPLATTVIFTFLSSQRILNIGETTVPYPAFVMIGTLLWQTFLDSLNSPLRAVNSSRDLLTKVNFPREALILSGTADVLFNTGVRALLFIATFVVFGLPVTPTLFLVPLGVLVLILHGMAIGILLTPVGILYTDVGRAIGLVSGFWMLLTPVVYPPPTSGAGAVLATWNPVSPLILTCRQWLTGQPTTNLTQFAWVAVVSVLALIGGWIFFRLSVPHLIERIGN
jgi:lipopolysaccharide transport system permease protein